MLQSEFPIGCCVGEFCLRCVMVGRSRTFQERSGSFLLLFGLVSVFVNVLVDVRQTLHYACAKSTAVDVHVGAVVPESWRRHSGGQRTTDNQIYTYIET